MLLLLVLMIIHKHTVLFNILTILPEHSPYEAVHLDEKHTKLMLSWQLILQKHLQHMLKI